MLKSCFASTAVMINDGAVLISSEEFREGRGSDVKNVLIGTDSLFLLSSATLVHPR